MSQRPHQQLRVRHVPRPAGPAAFHSGLTAVFLFAAALAVLAAIASMLRGPRTVPARPPAPSADTAPQAGVHQDSDAFG